ncbi:hypothetical protein Pcinc_008602 [Petrolisthes cinctipes]|uniref:Thymidylate kinase-like domain-containing protein n=1 Tax=Petrolisthes cinctipes TaxID=88211 RepID=A0AAE1G6B5_PETCI|nr:hypothetical protein Pcinc_008602 [Petrolisthes cinctipes]
MITEAVLASRNVGRDPQSIDTFFPGIRQFLYITNGQMEHDAHNFCNVAMKKAVRPIAVRSDEANVDYFSMTESVVNRMGKNVDDGINYDIACNYIVSMCKETWFKETLITSFDWCFERLPSAQRFEEKDSDIIFQECVRLLNDWRRKGKPAYGERRMFRAEKEWKTGKFIAIEGVDGIGKTTLAKRLAAPHDNAVYKSFPRRDTRVGKILNNYLSGDLKDLSKEAVHDLFV